MSNIFYAFLVHFLNKIPTCLRSTETEKQRCFSDQNDKINMKHKVQINRAF